MISFHKPAFILNLKERCRVIGSHEDQKEQARKQEIPQAENAGKKKIKGERAAKQACSQANKDRIKKRKVDDLSHPYGGTISRTDRYLNCQVLSSVLKAAMF